MAVLLSVGVHAAFVPLAGLAWLLADHSAKPPPAMEVTIVWDAAAPATAPDPTPDATPAAAPAVEAAPPPAAAAPPPIAEAPPPPPALPDPAPAPVAEAPPPPPAPPPPVVTALAEPPPPPPKPRPRPRPTAAPHPRAMQPRPAETAVSPAASPVPPADTAPATTTQTAAAVVAPHPAALPGPDRGALLSRYSKLVLERLESHKAYPPLALRRHLEGTVVVRLRLSKDGRLMTVEPVGQGPDGLVAASVSAVQDAAPFPPLPAGLGESDVAFDLPITYRIR